MESTLGFGFVLVLWCCGLGAGGLVGPVLFILQYKNGKMTRKMEVESDLIFGGRGGGLVFGKVPQINCQALLLGESNPFE
ncbi:Uncharacterized protein TCM_005847 [Theobroma cacao]|uniref:Uncharacterized protein n=1 Tax=Theobroma cacao TaxID=3641 RepID=A0A061DV25_THECC|nr:Uncharacterized protein TCM_005847 [Theobroma cacao]